MAQMEIDKNLVSSSVGKVSVGVENIGMTDLTGLKIVIYNETGAFELDTTPDTLGTSEIKVLYGTYYGDFIFDKIKVTCTQCPGIDDEVSLTLTYQEDADEPNYCTVGGFDKICDGNWTNFELEKTFTFYVNYTKPEGAIGAKWKVKGSGMPNTLRNITIPNSVWSYDTYKLYLQIYADNMVPELIYYGRNETGWEFFLRATETDLYEEAVWWNVIDE